MRREYVVSWETLTRYSCRHYSRYFETKQAAVAFAKNKKESNPLVTYLTVREQDSEEYTAPDGCPGSRVHVLRFIDWWKN